MKEILQRLSSYSINHPLRELVEFGYDMDLNPRLPEGMRALNILQPLLQVLQGFKVLNKTVYNSMLDDKLAAKNGKNDCDAHNLISALCELSIMNAFILASDKPESFQYEPRLVAGSQKNVEFSIEIGGICYNVEVKSANMIKEAKALEQNMVIEGQTIEPNERILPPEEWKKIVGGTPIMWSLDNKVKDFLQDTQEKFSPISDDINLLVICWDGRYRKALTALKSETNGLLTANTYEPKLRCDHISHILVSSLYGFIIEWINGSLQPPYEQDPINLRFPYNFLIDYNLNKPADIHDRLLGILGCEKLPVVDEQYVDCNCEAVAFTLNLPIQL